MSPEESTAQVMQNVPTEILQIEQARREILASPESHRSHENAFYEAYPGEAEDADARLSSGIGRYLLGQEARARQELEGLDAPPAAYLRARIALNEARWLEALAEIEQVLKQQPDSLEARLVRAESLAQVGDHEALAAEAREMEQRHGDSSAVSYLQGLLQETLGQYDEAARLYQQTLVEEPDHVGALFRLAYHEGLRGEPETAIETYEKICMASPLPIGALINLGLLFEDEEEYSLAVNCFQRVLDFDPTNWRARTYLKDAVAGTRMFYDEERERTEDKRAQILRIPVTDFELSVRSRNCLANMNVRTLGDLIRLTEQELLSFKNFGETSLTEIKSILTQKGLRLGMLPREENRPLVSGIFADAGDRDSILVRSIEDLDLSVRSRKALENLEVRTIGDLTRIGEPQLLSCKNFGQTSLMEIKKKLADLGLALKAD